MRVSLSELTELQLLNGSMTLAFMIISLIIGFKILLKYFSIKQKEFITVGISWIFLSSAWWGTSLSFLFILLFNYAFDPITYIYIGNVFIPVLVIFWPYSVCSLLNYKRTNLILAIFLTISILYEILLAVFIIVNPDMIATYEGLFYLKPRGIGLAYIIFAILTLIVFSLLFVLRSLRSEDPKIRLKGKLILLAVILFTSASVINALIMLTAATLIVVRIFLISSQILYYFGFLLPKSIASRYD
ncbi:MAG: hypothetical protein ACFFAO_18275 [Candidatus Hermodarchaeota archaeon]